LFRITHIRAGRDGECSNKEGDHFFHITTPKIERIYCLAQGKRAAKKPRNVPAAGLSAA